MLSICESSSYKPQFVRESNTTFKRLSISLFLLSGGNASIETLSLPSIFVNFQVKDNFLILNLYIRASFDINVLGPTCRQYRLAEGGQGIVNSNVTVLLFLETLLLLQFYQQSLS